MVARIAKEFGQLPEVVAAVLDAAPERLSPACITLLRYAEAHEVFRSADRKRIAEYRKRGGRALMARVEKNDRVLRGLDDDGSDQDEEGD